MSGATRDRLPARRRDRATRDKAREIGAVLAARRAADVELRRPAGDDVPGGRGDRHDPARRTPGSRRRRCGTRPARTRWPTTPGSRSTPSVARPASGAPGTRARTPPTPTTSTKLRRRDGDGGAQRPRPPGSAPCSCSPAPTAPSSSADGVVEGVIADAPRGTEGFGYDPVFVPAGGRRSDVRRDDARPRSRRSRTAAGRCGRWRRGCARLTPPTDGCRRQEPRMPLDPQAKVVIDMIEALGVVELTADTDPNAVRALMNAAVHPERDRGRVGRRPGDPRPGRRDPGAHLPARGRRAEAGRRLLPRRRLGDRAGLETHDGTCRRLRRRVPTPSSCRSTTAGARAPRSRPRSTTAVRRARLGRTPTRPSSAPTPAGSRSRATAPAATSPRSSRQLARDAAGRRSASSCSIYPVTDHEFDSRSR